MSKSLAKLDFDPQVKPKELSKLPLQIKTALLEKLVHYHNIKYFIDNEPVISDEQFDELYEMLRRVKPDTPALFEIVGDIGEIRHPVPMLSIDKRYRYADVERWLNDTNDEKYIVEPKYDGMAARYQKGTLATRGNGIYGEDISARFSSLYVVGNLPKDNSSTYGEVIIPISYFEEKLKVEYKNPRNAVVGIMKSKTVTLAGIQALLDKGVHFVLHDQAKVIEAQKRELLNEDTWESILEEMFRVDYPLDGIVIKATSQELRSKLGATQHHDRWQIAYKTPAERKWSVIQEIKDQVGRTGRVTSVAVIDPVNLSGATVTNVTLHNVKFVKSSKIGIGSKVEVMRSGEVIPFITKVIPAESPHIIRMDCPVCGGKLVENGKYLECINSSCPARLSQSIEYFFKVLGAEELGLKTIERFINEFKLNYVVDFYDLKKDKIAELDGFGNKSANNIMTNISRTLEDSITPSQLLQALGVKNIGPAASRWIINKYGFDNLPYLKKEDLEDVSGIGPIKAGHFIKEVKEKWPIVLDLQKRGLKFKKDNISNKLEGLSFCITGSQGKYSRDELIQLIIENGGEYKSSVTKDLDYLIAGTNPGSKLEKAKELGVKVADEGEFLKLVK
ncbi:hypothetical protein A2982_03090 [candidate division WWE3 bacterium RIFCSPLOWO2_01_FULL_39_13]|uniref:DNA ligase n=1 Tax=candidate division WWE3 bacterium RIFCSPLOWO2_01_FULL_39_13 TaxID=1802624 RepID=A0A1F4V1R6_UNCKA|nr:MAG: hypothetical protein A2982_03090 [candidate division WWE3 bacterium RIFCSPLOWO2_01_FULL_39_13]